MSDLMKQECPSCGWFPEFPEDDEQSWEYTITLYENRMEAIKKSEIRMRYEFGYGIPETWRENENKKR